MGRHPQPGIRARLLAACTDEVLAHGLPTGLARLAQAAGTSPRMLIYHFGTHDALLRQVLTEARRRQVNLFGCALAPRPGEAYPHTLARAWTLLTGPQGAPFLRLFSTVHDTATTEGSLWPDFRKTATLDWLAPLEEGLRFYGPAAPALASCVLAVVRGLLLDRDATDDTTRTDEAFAAFLVLMQAHPDDAAGDGRSVVVTT